MKTAVAKVKVLKVVTLLVFYSLFSLLISSFNFKFTFYLM